MKRSRAVTEMLLLFLAFFLPGYLAQSFGAAPGSVTNLVFLQSIVTGLPQLLLVGYVAGITGIFSSPKWGCIKPEPRDAIRLVLLVVACFAIIAPFAALAFALPREWTSSLTAGYRWGLQSPTQIPLAFLFCLVAGYREELFFRAYLLRRFEEIGSPLPASIACSTLLFAMGHVYEGPLGIALAAGLGVLFSVVYARRRNLHLIAIAHTVYNLIVLCLSLFVSKALPGAFGMHIFFH